MKKVSIFSALAVIVALVASSFTVTMKKVPNDSWFKLIDQTKTQTYFNSNFTSEPFDISAAYDLTKRTLTNVQSSSVCPTGSTRLCAVKIDYSIPAGTDVNNLDDNDFSGSVSTDILGYQLKN
jgi:hypothetical protein